LEKQHLHNANNVLLRIEDLRTEYALSDKISVKAINNVSLNIRKGEVLGVVGESGCGKSTLAYSILKLVPPPGRIVSGKIIYYGWNPAKDIISLSERELQRYRWREVSLIAQAAQSTLNPIMRISEHFIDTAFAHGEKNKNQIIDTAKKLLKQVVLDENILNRYPHELSGGMKQRVIVALSLLLNPKLLILDEPTSALDLITQKCILNMLSRIKNELNLTMMFITHDFSILAEIATRIAVMYAGKVVEVAPIDDIFYNPVHPYTKGLINAIPSIVGDVHKVKSIPGIVPDLISLPPGCLFASRCPYQSDICKREDPPLKRLGGERYVACHRYYK